MKKNNPKALNLEKLRNTDKKVTLGFKCSPQLKISLANQAEANNMTLSEYVERLVMNIDEKYQYLRLKIKHLLKDINFYENEKLNQLFIENKGKTVSYINTTDNEKKEIRIDTMKDIYTIMVNSFIHK
jgi:hypothetical protein